jgi:two-component system nitrogen regulation response regulator NtrX
MNPQPTKVLIVDDNEHVRYQLRRILSSFGCEFAEAETGEDALTMIAATAFDVLFLDMRLPFGVTGMNVFIKAKETRPDLGKVIILTGWFEDETRAKAFALGAHDWLDKAPLDREKILNAFRSAIGIDGGDLP